MSLKLIINLAAGDKRIVAWRTLNHIIHPLKGQINPGAGVSCYWPIFNCPHRTFVASRKRSINIRECWKGPRWWSSFLSFTRHFGRCRQAVTEQVRGKRAVESMIIDRELKNGLLVRKKRNKWNVISAVHEPLSGIFLSCFCFGFLLSSPTRNRIDRTRVIERVCWKPLVSTHAAQLSTRWLLDRYVLFSNKTTFMTWSSFRSLHHNYLPATR